MSASHWSAPSSGHHHEARAPRSVRATVLHADQHGFELRFAEPQFAVAPGQSAVLYAGPRLLGGGLIADHARELPALT